MSSLKARKILRPQWLIGAVAGAAAALLVIAVSVSGDARSADALPLTAHFEGAVSFADVIESVAPAVVNISVEKVSRALPTQMPGFGSRGGSSPFDDFFERFFNGPGMPDAPAERRSQALGSGFVIDPSGYIVTNNHVIEDTDEVTVIFMDGSELEATIVGADAKTDLALLKVESPDDLAYVRFGDSDKARVGDWVVAIGNPFGLGGTATAGIISARGRDIRSGPYDDYLQIDAPINSGNSGGPVFNAAGEVIGVNTAIVSPNGGSIGIGFSIPSKQAANVIADLREDGAVTRGWLGVQIQGLDEDLAASLGIDDGAGALVSEVVAGSPAERGGLEPGDVIRSLDGQEIKDPKHLSRLVADANPGQSVELGILRDGRRRNLEIDLGNADTSQEVLARAGDQRGDRASTAGLELRSLTDEDRSRLGLPDTARGALVVGVDSESAAAAKGIRPGDVITEIDHKSVETPDQAIAAFNNAAQSKSERALVLVRRGDAQLYVALSLS